MMHRAGELRQNQTEAEAKLWSRLRAHPPQAWQAFSSADNTQLEIMWWTFARHEGK